MTTMAAQQLQDLMSQQLLALGLTKRHVQIISDALVQTSLFGIDTHGVRLFKTYVKELQGGRANISPDLRFERQVAVGGLLDADSANGVVAGHYAMTQAISRAQDFGISTVAVKNSNHYGAASVFSRMAAAQNLIGISMSNADALVALSGSDSQNTTKFLGTNPIAVSIPGENGQVFNLDFATSQIAWSKVMSCLAHNQPLQPGWAIDKDGQDSADTEQVEALQPLGGYKGQGLGLMVQLLTGVLCGMPFDHQLSHLYQAPFDQGRQVAHMFIVIDPALFIEPEHYQSRVSALLQSAQQLGENVVLPGVKEQQIYQQRLQNGILLDDEDVEYFATLAQQFGHKKEQH